MGKKARALPDWSVTDEVTLSRAYRARVDRTIELLQDIAAGLAQRQPAARSRKGTIRLKEGKR